MTDLAERLAARTLELVDIPSESRDEAALAAHVLRVLGDGGGRKRPSSGASAAKSSKPGAIQPSQRASGRPSGGTG